jgi:hypothetical protein
MDNNPLLYRHRCLNPYLHRETVIIDLDQRLLSQRNLIPTIHLIEANNGHLHLEIGRARDHLLATLWDRLLYLKFLLCTNLRHRGQNCTVEPNLTFLYYLAAKGGNGPDLSPKRTCSKTSQTHDGVGEQLKHWAILSTHIEKGQVVMEAFYLCLLLKLPAYLPVELEDMAQFLVDSQHTHY